MRGWTRKGVARAYMVSAIGKYSVSCRRWEVRERSLIQLESKRCSAEKWGWEVPFYTLIK